jgi:hypothetical protein
VALTADEIERQRIDTLATERRSTWVMPPTCIVFVPCSLVEVELVPDEWTDSILR